MRGKLFKHMFLVAMSVFVACTALFMWSLYSYFTEARQSEQREETAYAAAAVPSAVFAVVSFLESVVVAPVSELPQAANDTTIIALNNPAKIFFFMYCSPL